MEDSQLKTLWLSEVDPSWDDTTLAKYFPSSSLILARIVRDKENHMPLYGILEFTTNSAAGNILNSFNGKPIPGTDRFFKLAWSGNSSASAGEYSLFVGDLGPEISDYQLLAQFQARYPGVRSARVVVDPVTNQSKGYGFVRFADEAEALKAITEMQGMLCGTRPMRLAPATAKNGKALSLPAHMMAPPDPETIKQIENDPSNTTLFVGGLGMDVDEDVLKRTFGVYGNIMYVKLVREKSCGFVQFAYRYEAEAALEGMHGLPVGRNRVRLSWGRSPLARRADPMAGAAQAAALAQQQQQQHQQNSMMTPEYTAYLQQWESQQRQHMLQQQQALQQQQQAALLAQAEIDGYGHETNIFAENEDFIAKQISTFSMPWTAPPW